MQHPDRECISSYADTLERLRYGPASRVVAWVFTSLRGPNKVQSPEVTALLIRNTNQRPVGPVNRAIYGMRLLEYIEAQPQ